MFARRRRPLLPVTIVVAICAAVSCVALATSRREAHASGQTPQLPNLVADPPDHISLSISETSPTNEPAEPKLLLRFDGYVHNTGPGALDIRGSRPAPPDPNDLASPPMKVYQRIYEYESTEGPPPTGEEVPHKDVQLSAVMEYVEADGHYHWHLQHVAYYSLWNSTKSAEVAPAQKVGFCLDDSEHIEEKVGPPSKIYADTVPPFREFCKQLQPEATTVFEGVSAGWRDLYYYGLAFQWVDVSDVLPGEYWLREEVNPEHTIQERNQGEKIEYASSPSVIPGYDASAQSQETEFGHPLSLTLASVQWGSPGEAPEYTIDQAPKHGKLTPLEGDHTVYTPEAGYSGPDSFTFTTRDPSSSFPAHPEIATVAISVKQAPSVAIEGAPSSMIAGTSVQLSAIVNHDNAEVKWGASAGSITLTGSTTAIYTAPSIPPSSKLATITSETPKGGRDQRVIEILPVPVPQPKPEVPTPPVSPPPPTQPAATPPVVSTPVHGAPAPALGPKAVPSFGGWPVSTPATMLIGRKLYMTATPRQAGRLRLTAMLHGQRIGSCVSRVRAHQSFTCATTLPRGVSTSEPISVWATLRIGSHLVQAVRRAAAIASAAKTMGSVSWLDAKQAWRYLCGM